MSHVLVIAIKPIIVRDFLHGSKLELYSDYFKVLNFNSKALL